MQATLSEKLRRVLLQPSGGVMGLVNELLEIGSEHGLQLDWHAGSCHVRSLGDDAKELLTAPLRKSVFRAILARVAALCNERAPSSVSPFGGQGELSVSDKPATVVKVVLENTPERQKLELAPASESNDQHRERYAPKRGDAHDLQ